LLLSWPRPPLQTYVGTYVRTDTLPRLIYKDRGVRTFRRQTVWVDMMGRTLVLLAK